LFEIIKIIAKIKRKEKFYNKILLINLEIFGNNSKILKMFTILLKVK